METCAKNGVKDIVEVKIGYDGTIFATLSNKPTDFTVSGSVFMV